MQKKNESKTKDKVITPKESIVDEPSLFHVISTPILLTLQAPKVYKTPCENVLKIAQDLQNKPNLTVKEQRIKVMLETNCSPNARAKCNIYRQSGSFSSRIIPTNT